MAGKLNLDPQGIVDKEFDIDFKGYNPDQVDHMLDLVIQDLSKSLRRNGS